MTNATQELAPVSGQHRRSDRAWRVPKTRLAAEAEENIRLKEPETDSAAKPKNTKKSASKLNLREQLQAFRHKDLSETWGRYRELLACIDEPATKQDGAQLDLCLEVLEIDDDDFNTHIEVVNEAKALADKCKLEQEEQSTIQARISAGIRAPNLAAIDLKTQAMIDANPAAYPDHDKTMETERVKAVEGSAMDLSELKFARSQASRAMMLASTKLRTLRAQFPEVLKDI